MFTIASHRLQGNDPQGNAVGFAPSANFNGTIVPKFLVFHYTACSAAAARNVFLRFTGDNRVSAHLLVDVDGSVTQFVDFDKRAWHAGASTWDSFHDLNSHSIGIEVVNFGYLQKSASNTFKTADGRNTVPPDEAIEARHRLPHWPWRYWQEYSTAQIETCEALAELLVSTYQLRDVVGHDDIAPTRKSDPGPAFPLDRIRGRALGRDNQSQVDQAFVAVDKLNIRTGAGTGFAKAGPPLPRNTRLQLLGGRTGDWLEVAALQDPPVKGWVFAAYTGAQLS